MLNKDKRITLATLKSFIKHNADNIHINLLSTFDSMIDCVSNRNDGFKHTLFNGSKIKNTLGYDGIWVNRTGNGFYYFENKDYIGIEVSNSCGNFIVASKKV